MDMDSTMLALILVPAVAGVLALIARKTSSVVGSVASLLATAVGLGLAIKAFGFTHSGGESGWVLPFGGAALHIEIALRLYTLSGFALLAVAGFGILVTLYCLPFMKNRPFANDFYGMMLLSIGMTNGAILSDNLVGMLFFWEGLLVTLLGMIAIGRPGAFKTATKAFIIVGVTDLCMMLGIALTGSLASSAGCANPLSISAIKALHLSTAGLGGLAMVMLMIGAISKAGSMPFHSWIPDAAVDAPLPFMAILPASLEKLLGIYFLARITLDIYHVETMSWMSWMMMTIGAITIVLAVMMALVQKDYKRLLSYHAISQVGYMVLGIGTALPIGIVGGLFHMINHAMYKSCLFLTGGSVEKQAGTTDLEKLGGLAGKMPITFACFFVAAASISGMWPFNGFFSKELVYAAAWDRNFVFYGAAILGTFLTAASFLKLGHAAFCGPRSSANDSVKEAPVAMLLPMIVIAAGCVLFGLWNYLPLQNLIEPAVKSSLGAATWEKLAEGGTFAAPLIPHEGHWLLPLIAMIAIFGALFNHLIGVRMGGSGLKAVDHIYHSPVLEGVYERAGRRVFDPYDIGLKLVYVASQILWAIDRGIDWIYDRAAVGVSFAMSTGIRRAHNGSFPMYVFWCLGATVLIVIFLIV